MSKTTARTINDKIDQAIESVVVVSIFTLALSIVPLPALACDEACDRVHDRIEARITNRYTAADKVVLDKAHASAQRKVNKSAEEINAVTDAKFNGLAGELEAVQAASNKRVSRAFDRVFDLQAGNFDIVRADGDGLQFHGGLGGNTTGGGGGVGLSYQFKSGEIFWVKGVVGFRHGDGLGQAGFTIPVSMK